MAPPAAVAVAERDVRDGAAARTPHRVGAARRLIQGAPGAEPRQTPAVVVVEAAESSESTVGGRQWTTDYQLPTITLLSPPSW
jgi:hypothetical protein